MAADDPETDVSPVRPARVAFRSRAAAAPMTVAQPVAVAALPPPPPSLAFAPIASAHGSDRDILMGYQIFLGRDPENSFVITEAKSSPLRGFVNGLLLSGEFETAVLQPLARRAAMPHERAGLGPMPEQLDWLTDLLTLPLALIEAFRRDSTDWRSFWSALTAMPGFPRGSEAATPAGVAAVDASEGFALVTLEQPRPGDKLHPGAAVNGAGWAIAPEDIAEVTVTLDGRVLAQARHGLPRPDVARNFPHYRHVDHCGFAFSAVVPADAVITSHSQLAVVVRTVGGQTGRRYVRVTPPAPPPTQIALPLRLTVEDARVDAGGMLRLRGWALSRAGTPKVSVFLGATMLGQAEIGQQSPAIGSTYSDYPGAGRSGFTFGAPMPAGLEGPASIRVQAADTVEQRQVIVPVGLTRVAAAQDGTSRFQCDEAAVAPDGRVTIAGWALPEAGVQDIAVLRGRKSVASPIHGSARPDIARLFPAVPEASRAGFRCTFAPNPPLRAGEVVTLRLRTGAGETLLLEVPLTDTVSAQARSSATSPVIASTGGTRLDVDTPALDGEMAHAPVRGALTVAGWAVAPSGIAEVTVQCDGATLGSAYLGERREDLGRQFPDCVDALRGGFALVLPPGGVAEGFHRFTVTATSRSGEAQSRHFTAVVEPPDHALPGTTPRLTMPRTEQAFLHAILAAQSYEPDFDIVVQGSEADDALRATLASLARQAYARFTITGEEALVALGAAFPALAGRVAAPKAADGTGRKGRVRKPAGALATVSASPRLIIMLRAGDVLGCDALLELAVARAMDPRLDFIYADEQRFDAVHGHVAPFHKPDWSPELQLNMDYVGRPWCATQNAMQTAGLTLADLAGRSPYAVSLALTRAAGRVGHLDKVLAATTATTTAAEASDAIAASGPKSESQTDLLEGVVAGTWRLRRKSAFVDKVAVIIPTAGQGGLVRRAIASLRATTPRALVEIVVLDNVPAGDGATKAWLADNADQVIPMPGAFNWSRFNNLAVAQTNAPMLLFLNDDIEARAPGWLEAMLEHATRPEVGVTGARLLYPDGKVQHGGVFLADNSGRHAFRFAAGDDAGPFGIARVSRDMSAVTGACQMVRREVFDLLGGFDEAHDVVNNDVDFCLRARAAGLSVIFTPHAELMHHELASRALIEDRHDATRFLADWRTTMLRGDPFHSRRLRGGTDYEEPDLEPVLPVHAGPRGPEAASIKRILAVKLDHIGDFLTALPALTLLRARFPAARITLLAPPASAALCQGRDVIDEIIEFTFFHVRSADGLRVVTEREYADLAARLTPLAFDMAIDLRMHPETRLVLRQSGAPFLVGYDRNGAFPWLDVRLEFEGDEKLHPKPGHIAERLLALVEAAALACRSVATQTIPPRRDVTTVPALARLPADFLTKRLICIHPGVGNTMRRWPAAHFGALIDLLAETEDIHAILVGGAEEQEFAREVQAATTAQDRVISLAGALTLQALGEVIEACVLFVGNDSGPKHVAASLGVPTLGIHSAVVDAEEWAPLGTASFALERRVVCSPCYLAFAAECPRNLACLTGLQPRDAWAAARRLLALRPGATI